MQINKTIIQNLLTLHSNRLTLRELQRSDPEKTLEMPSNGCVNQFIARNAMEGLENAEALMERSHPF